MPTQLLLLFLFLSTERIDESYFKAPLATRQTTSEDAWALFTDNEYSNKFNISFAIVDTSR